METVSADMDPLLIEATKTIVLEATKILGPAIVAALATFKATKAQFELKLKELERVHAFGARQHWFNYYKERQDRLARDHERLNDGLGQIMGMAAGIVEGAKETDGDVVSTLAETVQTIAKMTASEIEAISRDMKDVGLSGAGDYQSLVSYVEPLRNIDRTVSFAPLKQNLLLVLEASQYLQRCNDALLKREMKSAFSKYVDA